MSLELENITDPLTGVYNRRFLDRSLQLEIAKAERHDTPLSALLLDLDHFKRINDTHGHQAGDRVLKAFAELLVRTARNTDTVSRFGGEEFVVLAPFTGSAVAATLAERLRATVERSVLPPASKGGSRDDVRATVSIGVASLAPGIRSAQEMLRAADEALYHAKKTGRNRVVSALASPPMLQAAEKIP